MKILHDSEFLMYCKLDLIEFHIKCFMLNVSYVSSRQFVYPTSFFYQLGELMKYIFLKNEPRHGGHLTHLISIHLIHMTYLGKITLLWISWF